MLARLARTGTRPQPPSIHLPHPARALGRGHASRWLSPQAHVRTAATPQRRFHTFDSKHPNAGGRLPNRANKALLDQLQTSAEASCSLEWAPLSDREALLSDMHMASVQANRTLGKVDDAMQCDNLYDQWAVIENAMCNELVTGDKTCQNLKGVVPRRCLLDPKPILPKHPVTGLWQLWAVHAVAAVFLYLALYLTSYVKQKCKVLKLLDEEGTVRAVPLGPPLAPAMTV